MSDAHAFDWTWLPPRRVGSGVLLRNEAGDVLLVEPTYKQHWEIPGGLVEANESPKQAARRECFEELGVEVPVGDLLCIDFVVAHRGRPEGFMIVFDGGVTSLAIDDLVLPPDELRSAKFVAPAELETYLRHTMASRVRRAIQAAADKRVSYTEWFGELDIAGEARVG